MIMDSEATFSYTDGFVEFGAGVVIPTFDIYSDVSLIALLLSIRDAPPGSHHTVAMFKEIRLLVLSFGKIMIIPLILSTLFIFPHWLKCEKTLKRRLLTFPLVLLQMYPQYRSMRVLWWAFIKKNHTQCLREKRHNDCSTSYVGKFLAHLTNFLDILQPVYTYIIISEVFTEAVIQLHLSFLLNGLLASMDTNWNSNLYFQGFEPYLGWLGDNKWLIWLSFSIFASSAIFGLSKFLKIGPVKIVNDGPEVSLIGFGITLIIISSFMISKAVWVPLNIYSANGNYK